MYDIPCQDNETIVFAEGHTAKTICYNTSKLIQKIYIQCVHITYNVFLNDPS